MFENLNLALRCQVLVSEKDNTAFVDEGSKLIQLLLIQLTQLNILELRAWELVSFLYQKLPKEVYMYQCFQSHRRV